MATSHRGIDCRLTLRASDLVRKVYKRSRNEREIFIATICAENGEISAFDKRQIVTGPPLGNANLVGGSRATVVGIYG